MIGRTFAVLLALAGVVVAWAWYGPWVALAVGAVYTVAAGQPRQEALTSGHPD